MQGSCKELHMSFLILLVLLVVLKLVSAAVNCFDRVDWEQVQDVVFVFLDRHSEGGFKHEVESVWLLYELDAAIRAIFLHS